MSHARAPVAVAVMAKAPVAGQAKTRLVPALGEAGAAALAARLLQHAVAQAAGAALGPVTLWAAPDATHAAFVQAQAVHGLALAEQGEGDLGTRMARVFTHTPGPCLLMGSDVPALDAARLREAADALQHADAVFVPALDGGYALVGLRAATPPLLAALFEGMTWSHPQVMAQTKQRLAAAGFSHLALAAVADIDEPADLQHLPSGWLAELQAAAAPGRSCPLYYRYRPEDLAQAEPLRCDTLYVVGGLYGNEPALQQVLALFEREPGDKRLVFNGDFHWFDVDPGAFERISRTVLQHDALRGNVETELAEEGEQGDGGDNGCGCAYPAWVGDGVVERSNQIFRRLRETSRAFPDLRRALGQLPMRLRVDVGPLRLAIVHGDAESLAGWDFAAEHLQDPAHRERVREVFDRAQVDAFACSHTCLPVFQRLPRRGRVHPPLVLNNGAAGMPNFAGDGAGLITRVALRPFAGPARRHGLVQDGVHVDALAVDSAGPDWQAQFLQQWPPGSDAHASYWSRITQGPAWQPAQALPEVA